MQLMLALNSLCSMLISATLLPQLPEWWGYGDASTHPVSFFLYDVYMGFSVIATER